LKYKVDKRMRRRAKWIQWDTRQKVRAEQDRALPEMVPAGTSMVMCSRLNFHQFKRLSRRVKKYFGYLALAHYHDRMDQRCRNVGAVLVNNNEGYTTKRCPNCGQHNNVGAAKKFKCRHCKFECGRDLKGTFCILQRDLYFVF